MLRSAWWPKWSPSALGFDQFGRRDAYAREWVFHLRFVDPEARTLEAFELRGPMQGWLHRLPMMPRFRCCPSMPSSLHLMHFGRRRRLPHRFKLTINDEGRLSGGGSLQALTAWHSAGIVGLAREPDA